MRWDATGHGRPFARSASFWLACGLWLLAGCSGEVDGAGRALDAGIDAASAASGQAGSMQLAPIGGAGGGAGQSGSGGAHAGSGGTQPVMPMLDAGTDPQSDDAGRDSGAPDAGEEPSGAPAVRFIGRTVMGQAGVVRMEWSGSGIAFRFSGTQASILLDDSGGSFTRLIDGEQIENLTTSPGERSYQLASGLLDAVHQVELYRRTEASFGETRYVDVDLGADGTLLAPPVRKKRRIELIGDSITCGYGDEGLTGDCPFEAATENHYLTYGAISARALDAELVTIAWSGKGVIYNYDEDKNEPMPALYDRAVPTDASTPWGFPDADEPDAVVINLGTNDFSTGNDPSESVFSDAYSALLVRLRAYHPDAWIVCLSPTGIGGDELTTVEGYITSVVSERNGQDDARVVAKTLTFTSTGAGCSYHPSLATHASMADALTTELESVLGW